MPEIHATMTGLETAFEDELSHVPGWHSETMEAKEATTGATRTSRDQALDKAVEQSMLLGD